jgi:hypothetical protein
MTTKIAGVTNFTTVVHRAVWMIRLVTAEGFSSRRRSAATASASSAAVCWARNPRIPDASRIPAAAIFVATDPPKPPSSDIATMVTVSRNVGASCETMMCSRARDQSSSKSFSFTLSTIRMPQASQTLFPNVSTHEVRQTTDVLEQSRNISPLALPHGRLDYHHPD